MGLDFAGEADRDRVRCVCKKSKKVSNPSGSSKNVFNRIRVKWEAYQELFLVYDQKNTCAKYRKGSSQINSVKF